jgi:UDP-N-acetylglucosamine enolpyruvyl transferase
MLNPSTGTLRSTKMNTQTKPQTITQLVETIYEDNFSHLDFMDNMGGDCDCVIHTTLETILKYWEVK